ncbi:MAG: sensor histidine kinase [Rhodoferax sp.]|jgi:two-component system sensor histidine kinase UhpB|nr:sensor histidine kinase [Rhodoferax sp.]
MDLRKRLVGFISALLLALLTLTVLANLLALRSDVTAEVDASMQLVKFLSEVGQIDSSLPPIEAAAHLEAILKSAPLRHVSVSIGAEPPTVSRRVETHWLATLLGVEPVNDAPQLLRMGNHNLWITPNPVSEIEEGLGDTIRLCIALFLFSAATLLVVWWSADCALALVRELEAGLQRLARGEKEAALPGFALREFRRVATAIDDLAAALSASQDAQRRLSRQLICVQEDERRALALELHDEMGQTLTAIGVTAAHLERNALQLAPQSVIECAHDVRRDVRTSGEQLRAMLKRLRPHGLDASGLTCALRDLVAGWQQRATGIRFRFELRGTLPAIGEDAGLTLYRVVQEALTNVVRHSQATNCLVEINVDASDLVLQIEDDGCGPPPGGLRRGVGLFGIEERLLMVGGNLKIKPGLLRGMQLQVRLPLVQKAVLETT